MTVYALEPNAAPVGVRRVRLSAPSLDVAAALGPDRWEPMVELAHDLRSPLTAVIALAEALQRGQSGPVNEIQARQLGLIYSAALGLAAVANDVIELARRGDRAPDPEPVAFSVAEVFASVLEIVGPMAEEKGVAVKVAPVAHDRRLGHPRALSRVLLNLTTNALKHTDEGEVVLAARSRGSARVEFSVRDTGPGFDPRALRQLCEPFRPGPNTRRCLFSSSGLGLAICRKLVHAMGSVLEVESHPGHGARFSFELHLPPAVRAR